MNILESGKRGWVQRWRQDEGEREREREASRRRGGGSNSSSEVISLIHSGRCANILLKISWQHTHGTHA